MESAVDFPFRNIRKDVYLTLEVMMYVEHEDAYKFMFNINKEGRMYLIIIKFKLIYDLKSFQISLRAINLLSAVYSIFKTLSLYYNDPSKH